VPAKTSPARIPCVGNLHLGQAALAPSSSSAGFKEKVLNKLGSAKVAKISLRSFPFASASFFLPSVTVRRTHSANREPYRYPQGSETGRRVQARRP